MRNSVSVCGPATASRLAEKRSQWPFDEITGKPLKALRRVSANRHAHRNRQETLRGTLHLSSNLSP